MSFHLGPLYVEGGCALHRLGRLWVPSDLHVWVGSRGVHLFAFKGDGRRVVFDRAASKETT